MRKIFVMTIAIVYMAIGLWDFVNTSWANLISVTDHRAYITIPVFGVLLFVASVNILRFNDSGRKIMIILLSLFVVPYIWMVVKILSMLPITATESAEYYIRIRGVDAYYFPNLETFLGFMVAYIVVNLLVIWFLSQEATKKIFAQDHTQTQTGDVTA